ncbi:MAG TPA: hypothetical protein VFT22_19745 [Kofleriaceae bacterium]|nr:hypothetical protein [Kofleriaceae bacterium]
MATLDLGLTDVHPLPGLAADPERWEQLRARMHRRVFLRSEGNLIDVATPQTVSGPLLERSAEIVARFNRFYAGVAAAYYERPELRAEHLVNSLLDPLLEIDAAHPITTPLSRLDAVLEADGSIRVIEINSVGVCLVHMRGLFYLIRELARGGFEDDARLLDQLSRDMIVQGFLRFAAARLGSAPARPVIGALTPSGWYRAGHLLYRAAFQRAGCDYVFGGPEHLEVTDREIRIRGTRIDILWADFFFYMAYQCARYQETRFPTKMPDFGQTPAQAAELLANRKFLDHLRTNRVVNISPGRAYLALPKSLLSWIHRSDRPVPEADRAFLAEHVARTYSARDRADGLITIEAARRHRGDYLVKPCQYGASHGVLLGRMAEPDAWSAKLAEMWDDPSWALQELREPVKTSSGEWVSLGLSNFDGALGGVYLRTSPSLLINARDSGFVAAVPVRPAP